MSKNYVVLKNFNIPVEEFSAVHTLLKHCSVNHKPVNSDEVLFWITTEDPFTRMETTCAAKEVRFEIDNTKQERYQGKSGEDLIDRWARESTPEIFRAKIMAQFDRYTSRYGKKDEPLVEAKKLLDYSNRLVQYEENLIKEEG